MSVEAEGNGQASGAGGAYSGERICSGRAGEEEMAWRVGRSSLATAACEQTSGARMEASNSRRNGSRR